MTRIGTLALAAVLGASAAALAAPPPLSFTKQQADRGRLQYLEHCAECHGGHMQGHIGPALAGGDGGVQFESTAYVWNYITAQMPHGNPGGLSEREYVDVMAYLLQMHERRPGRTPLTKAALLAGTRPIGGVPPPPP